MHSASDTVQPGSTVGITIYITWFVYIVKAENNMWDAVVTISDEMWMRW
jgi:hypothetical protein